jgi:hypothetical protein
VFYLNKAYELEQELEGELSRRAAALLAAPPEDVTLRRASPGKGYVLTFSVRRSPELGDRISVETPVAVTKFRIHAERFDEALGLIEVNRGRFR